MSGIRVSRRFIPRRLRRADVSVIEAEPVPGLRIPLTAVPSTCPSRDENDLATEQEWNYVAGLSELGSFDRTGSLRYGDFFEVAVV